MYRLASRLRRRGSRGPSNGKDLSSNGKDLSSEWYDKSFVEHSRWQVPYPQAPWYHLWAVIVDRVQAIDAPYVLDIGCGPGQLAAFLCDRGITDYVGFDFSPARIVHARSIAPDMQFFVADAFATDLFDSVPYNAALCCEFLEHVVDDVAVIRRLRHGTRFIATVPNFGGVDHVRHFENALQVLKRYESCFDQLRVDAFKARDPGYEHFLIDGVTRSETSSL